MAVMAMMTMMMMLVMVMMTSDDFIACEIYIVKKIFLMVNEEEGDSNIIMGR